MGMLDELMAQAGGNIDLAAIGAKVGLTPEQVQQAAGHLLPQIADPKIDNQTAIDDAATKTGLSASSLSELVPALVQAAGQSSTSGAGGVLGSLLSGLGSAGLQQGGMIGTVSKMLDRDGDGNPINDILGMFGKK